MNRTDWIVCERTSRWASALRMALAADGAAHLLREIRLLAELDAELAARPTCLAAIEVDRPTFAAALGKISPLRKTFPSVRFVALVDRSLAEDFADVSDVLFEAGVAAISRSPRRLEAIVDLGVRHAANYRPPEASVPLVERIWASLPWQAV